MLENTEAKQEHNTICGGHKYMQANTYNVNKTWAPLQTTGGPLLICTR
jgi:hypothetical protein